LWEEFEDAEKFAKGQILFHLHHRRMHEGEHNAALVMAEQARDIYTEIDRAREISFANQLMGHAYSAMHDYSKSIEAYNLAASQFISCGADYDTAWNEKYIGDVYCHLDDFKSAVDHYESSVRLFESIDDYRGISMSTLEKADAHYELGEFKDAVAAYDLAISSAIKGDVPHQIYRAHVGAAYAQLALGNGEKALELAEKALALGKTCSCQNCEVDAQVLVGRALALTGQMKPAIFHLDNARKIFLERSEPKRQLTTIVEIAHCELGRSPAKAREMLLHARTLSELYPSFVRAKTRIYWGLGLLALQEDAFETACQNLEIAYDTALTKPKLTAERHRLLPLYLDLLASLERFNEVLEILEAIEDEQDFWCLPDDIRFMHQARANFFCGKTEVALTLANEGIYHAGSCESDIEVKAVLHEIRGRALIASDPREANNSFHKAMAYYLQIGQPGLANAVGELSVVEPERRLQDIVDHEDNRNTYEQLFGTKDPIVEQVKDDMEQERKIANETEEQA
ncbi:MAG: tetratricopeptide repeat protein, partial [Actinobacteria bacterium]|nr:tetratricopeptide repeat protein [Actinomycetota bacterium]